MKTIVPEILLLVAMTALMFCMLNIAHLNNVAAFIGALVLVAIGRAIVAIERRAKRRKRAAH